MKIYVSGLYCGTNPQPGVGIARSLRAGYPEATLVGVEYSNRSSGLHWKDFDELWLQRPWEELSLEDYGSRIRDLLDSGALWVSGSDLESLWLSDVFPEGHPNLLTPPGAALKQITKPAVRAAEGLPLRIPTFISTDCSDWEIHAFCRQHDWRVWLKGPYYDASRVGSWGDFEYVRGALSKVWATERLFVQAHVTGYEESVVLSAYKGELAGCVRMRKREITPEGKTWAGDVTEVPEEFAAKLREIVRRLDWTGGAELEMVRDAEGQLWLLEWNPRFPAWIHGATIAGRNMPALLVEAATGVPAREARHVSEEFTRVVLEVPVRSQLPLPPLPEPFSGAVGHSLKHPSGLPALAERLHKLRPEMFKAEAAPGANGNGNGNGNGKGHGGVKVSCAPAVPDSFLSDISGYEFAEVATPSWLFLGGTAAEVFGRAAKLAGGLSTAEVAVTNAYSIKTNPDARLIKLALEHGFLAEAISLLEVQKALEVGFRPDQVVLNGPGKWWPEGLMPKEEMHAVFCDSVADLRRVAAAAGRGELRSKTFGVRLRTPQIASRFGIPVDSPDAFEALVEAVALLPRDSAFGIHFHMASSNVGVGQWWHLYESMLRWCRSVERLTGRAVETLDVGGGWFPDDWHTDSGERFAAAVASAREHLPNLRQIISEPGKAMSQPTMALAMRLLEVDEPRRSGGGDDDEEGEETLEAVVDGSIAELPMHAFQPHRILGRDPSTGEWRPLGRGKTRLMGRLCMEHDVVAWNVELPEGVGAGDVLIFCDAGAYDRSMSYVFGRG
ncbi:MAG TPA: ATP-grasp domain-containing protein [Pyrinomonadaceae bacterium]|jgi:diaminopimelate decarboxylase